MKKTLLLAVLALALPTALFAGSSVDFTNSGGSLSGTSSGLTLSGSTLIDVKGLNGNGLVQGSNLGSFQLGTGVLLSGALTGDCGGVTPCVIATFSSTGSWFTITGNGSNGLPNGVIFSGTFSSPAHLLYMGMGVNGTHDYVLAAQLMIGNGGSGTTTQLIINTGKGFFDGGAEIESGDTAVVATPEPGSLGLLGTGLIGLAGLVHRKLRS